MVGLDAVVRLQPARHEKTQHAPESTGKNKRGLTVSIPSSGSKEAIGSAKVNKMSPPPSFGMEGSANAFLTSPGGQAFGLN